MVIISCQLHCTIGETLCCLQTRENNCFPSPTPSKQCPHNVVHLLASHAGVFGPGELVFHHEKRAPLKTPAWEAMHLYVRRTNAWNTGSLSFLLRVGDKTRQRFWTRITPFLVLSLHNYYDVTVTWLPCEQRLFDLRRASARRVWFLEYDRHHDQIFLRTENLCLNSDEITSLLIHALNLILLFLCSYIS